MPSNVARALSATLITRARSNESWYWNLTLTPITAAPVACPRERDATDRCDLSPSGGHGQARPAGQRATEILKARPGVAVDPLEYELCSCPLLPTNRDGGGSAGKLDRVGPALPSGTT